MDIDIIINSLSKEAENLFIPRKLKHSSARSMLIIIPDLRLGGTLTVLMELFALFDGCGYQLFVISSEDGQYRDKLVCAGAVVAIRPYVACTQRYRNFLQSAFDCVFLNSAACYYYIYYFINTDVKTIWWFHETKTQLETMQGNFPHLGLLSKNIQIAGVTQAVCRGIQKSYGIKTHVLPMPIADQRNPCKEREISDGRTIFFIPAAYTYIKGQDILLKTIAQMPESYMNKSTFVFCGYQLTDQSAYYDALKRLASLLENVVFIGELDKVEVYAWYQKCNCVIAPSRVDATPTTIVEAMMFEKPCIVSQAAGISEYMQDCINGLIFPVEDQTELLKRIMLIIEEPALACEIAAQGRKIYEQNFSIPAVSEKLRLLDKDLF